MKKILFFTLIIFFILSFNEIFAQSPPPPPGEEEDPCGWPPGNCVPIDGGIGFLLAAALTFGAKKLHDHKKLP